MNGFVNILKPTGMTSSDVVVIVRGVLRSHSGQMLKVGHFGTLDPGGAGVLPVAIGRATRLFDYALNEGKVYRAEFCFGKTTDTLDSYGNIANTCDKIPTLNEIMSVLPKLTGNICQVPPMYSSISISGKRAYELARQGETVDIKGRNVVINSIKFIEQTETGFVFDIDCSSGTYIRSLVRDMAKLLGTVGYMSYIIRLKSGRFSIENSVTLEEFKLNPEKYLIPIEYFTDSLPRYDVNEKYSTAVLNGVKIYLKDLPSGFFTVYLNQKLLGIGANDKGKLSIRTRLI